MLALIRTGNWNRSYEISVPAPPRGEQGVLLLTSDYFLRTRHNPFFEFQSRHLTRWLEEI